MNRANDPVARPLIGPMALRLVVAMFLTAFGGRSETPADPSAAVAIVSTDLQAKTRAPRSADAMFANDNMNSEVILAAPAPLPIGAARVQRPWRERAEP